MPDTKSTHYFENIVRGLNNLQKQLTLFQKQTIENAKLTASVKRQNSALKQQNLALRRTITALRDTERQTHRTARAAQFMTVTWGGVARVIVGSVVSRGIQELINSMTDGITKTREFTIRIGEIRTISQNAQQSFAEWSGQVRQLSDAFGFPILDVAEATYETLSNQIAEGAQSTIFMTEAARLARIGVSDLASSVNALSSIINAYNLDASAARRISDELFVAVDLGRFRLEDIGDSIGNVAVLANQLGVSFTELFATLTTLSRQGINVEQSMTLVRNVMLALIKPSEAMSDWMQREFGPASAELIVDAEGLVGVIDKLINITDNSQQPLTEFATLFNRIRGTVGAAGLATRDYNKDVLELQQSHEKANKAFEELSNNIGVKLTQELQRIKNVFTVDIGTSLQNTFSSINETIGGLANRLRDVLSVAKDISIILLSIGGVAVAANILTRIVALLRSVQGFSAIIMGHQTVISTQYLIQQRALLTIRNLSATIAAIMGSWKTLIVAAGIAIGALIISHRKNRERLQRTIEENIDSEIVQYKLMTDQKIAEDIRHHEARLQLTLDQFALAEKGIQQQINETQRAINEQKRLREEIRFYDKLLFDAQLKRLTSGKEEVTNWRKITREVRTTQNALTTLSRAGYNLPLTSRFSAANFELRKLIRSLDEGTKKVKIFKGEILLLGKRGTTGGPDFFGAAKLIGQEINKQYAELAKGIEKGTLSAREQERAFNDINNLIGQLAAIDGKRVTVANKIKTVTGEILVIGEGNRRATLDTTKMVDYWQNKLAKLAKKQRDVKQETLDALEATQGTLETLNATLKQLNKNLEAQKALRIEAEKAAEAYKKAKLEQKSALGETLNLTRQLEKLFTRSRLEDIFFGGTLKGLGGDPTASAKKAFEELIVKIENLQKQDVITDEQVVELQQEAAAIKAALLNALNFGTELPISIKQLFASLNVELSKLRTATEGTQFAASVFEPFEGAIKGASDQLVALQEAMHLFRTTSKSDLEATTAAWESLGRAIDAVINKINLALQKQAQLNVPKYFGGFLTRQAGGSVGKDSVPILASPGEFILNETATRKFLPQLIAMNSGSKRFESGGSVTNNNTIGDINVNVTQPGSNARDIAAQIRRELTRNTVRLN